MLIKLKKLVIVKHRNVFIPALFFGLVFGGIDSLRAYYIFMSDRFIEITLFISILRVVVVLLPIIMFVIFYRLGKNIDLRNSYVSVSASLLIGCTLGPFYGFFAGALIMKLISTAAAEFWWDSWGRQFYRATLSATINTPWLFFLGFIALALAYLRNREGSAEGVNDEVYV